MWGTYAERLFGSGGGDCGFDPGTACGARMKVELGKPLPAPVAPVGKPVDPAKLQLPVAAPVRSFQDWCLVKNKQADVRATVAGVFRLVGTKRCAEAAERLGKLERLDLSGLGVADLRPLAGLKGVKVLVLDRNPIRDLSPIANWNSLELLSVKGSSLKTLTGVAGLTNLKALAIDGSFVRDLEAVAGLASLESFSASGCRVQSVAPLAGLKNLRVLDLGHNQVEDLTPIALSQSLEEVYLNDNQVRDVRALGGVIALRILNLNNNKIKDFKALGSLGGLRRLEILGMPMETNPCPILAERAVCLYHKVPSESTEKPVTKPAK
ncbi:MAG: leucine-rich repeat domain-containing protein [Alkalinema sp. RU_4_3]|nr:leucine-rich repeat domain-containing protein [Alkalinema sp. RU_4_3]